VKFSKINLLYFRP